MSVNRFAPRGPSRALVVTLSIVGSVLVLAVAAVLFFTFASPFGQPDEIPPESFSEESGVKPSVFVPGATWNPESQSFELSAIVTARIDDAGSCTVTATLGAATVSAESPAVVDASTMLCGNIAVAAPGAQAGAWEVVVTYTADGFSAESEPVMVEVTA